MLIVFFTCVFVEEKLILSKTFCIEYLLFISGLTESLGMKGFQRAIVFSTYQTPMPLSRHRQRMKMGIFGVESISFGTPFHDTELLCHSEHSEESYLPQFSDRSG